MADLFDLLGPLFKNPYILCGFIAFVLFVIGLALPEKTKNANGTENNNKSMKITFIVLGIVIGLFDAGIYYFMNKRKSVRIAPEVFYF